MPIPLIPIVALSAGYVTLKGKADESASLGLAGVDVSSPSITEWTPQIEEQASSLGIPTAFAVQWMALESGGNPCAVGSLKAFGPDGSPREMGLGQLYNPDDFAALHITPASFRAYCTPGTQKLSRPLSDDEKHEQVRGLLALIVKCRNRADSILGGAWDKTSSDYWKFVKLQHGLPGLASGWKVTGGDTWSDFRAAVLVATLDAGTMRYASEFPRILDNAERTGAVVG